MSSAADPLLQVRDLHVSFTSRGSVARAVGGVDLDVGAGQTLGIVGESGSGKSVSMMSILRLLGGKNVSITGQALFRGQDLLSLDENVMRTIRGNEIAMIFQDPMTSLTPVYTIGWQIAEQLRTHTDLSKADAHTRAVDLLRQVGIPTPERRVDDYPHQFSGGMRQRAMIAMALSCNPSLLIADEPTTALDVTVQAQILDLMGSLQADYGSSIILITHDMGVVSTVADRVVVMYAGRVVEQGSRADVFRDPQHPYTWGLLGSIPRTDRARPRRLATIPGVPPSPAALPSGCAFAPRCAFAHAACDTVPLLSGPADHQAACHLPEESRAALRVPILDPTRADA